MTRGAGKVTNYALRARPLAEHSAGIQIPVDGRSETFPIASHAGICTVVLLFREWRGDIGA